MSGNQEQMAGRVLEQHALKLAAELGETQRRLHEANERMMQALNEQAAMTRRYTAAADLNKRLLDALVELVDGIEDSGGHTEDGDVFDIRKACAAIEQAEAELAKQVPHV